MEELQETLTKATEELQEILTKPVEALKKIFMEKGCSEAEASKNVYLFLQYKMMEELMKGE